MTGRMVKLVGSALLLIGLFWWSDTDEIARRLRGADPLWLMLGFVALTLTTLSMAHRWQITARVLGLEISYRHAVREYYLAQLINALLPGGVAGDVSRAFRIRTTGDLRRAGQSVMAERLVGQIAMFSILGFGLLGVSSGLFVLAGDPSSEAGQGVNWRLMAILMFMVVLVIAVGLFVAARLSSFADELVRLLWAVLSRGAVLVHALGAALLLIVSLYACARATGTRIPVEGWFTILPLVFCAMLIPLSVAGWGWREGAAAALFPLIGASPDAGIAMGVCYGALMLLAACPALLVWLRLPDRSVEMRSTDMRASGPVEVKRS